jgi:Mrp family chromosome partitioning ATPase
MAARTRSTELTRALQELSRSYTPLIGVVLNQVRLEHDYYYAYYYEYYHREDGPKAGPSEGRPAVPQLLPQESRVARAKE